MNPFVFIVGCARSGTTLLQRIVDAHPQIAILPEMHWITNYFRNQEWLPPGGRVTPEQVADMMEQKRFRQFELNREDFQGLLEPGASLPYAIFLNRLFALCGKNKGKRLVGNKTPPYVQRIRALHSLWPEAKFVHLIRDGRDVCLSVFDWNHADRTAGRYHTWAEDPVATTALWWERKVRLGREGGKPLGPGLYYEMRYEDLTARPAEECAKLCAFLGVPYAEAMLRFHEGRERTEPGLDAKKAWRPIIPGLRDWRSQMAPDAVERFEVVAGDLLGELGYPRAFPHPSPECKERVAQIRAAFTRELCARNEGVPARWQKFPQSTQAPECHAVTP
jgi:hypothetical protein